MDKDKLFNNKCLPCEGAEKPLVRQEAEVYLRQAEGWLFSVGGSSIYRQYSMKNFMAAVRFIESIAQIAETENHHPDIHLTSYRNLKIELSTHAIGGLSKNDFILAAKINKLPVELKIDRPKIN